MTEMYCMEDGVSDQEYAFLEALANVSSYGSIGSNLVLYDQSGTSLMTFTPRSFNQ